MTDGIGAVSVALPPTLPTSQAVSCGISACRTTGHHHAQWRAITTDRQHQARTRIARVDLPDQLRSLRDDDVVDGVSDDLAVVFRFNQVLNVFEEATP